MQTTRAFACITLLLAAACVQSQTPAADDPLWPVAGEQGLMRFVIVPAGLATDRAAYEGQILQLCPQGRTCFVNFYTNSSGAPLAVPLPDGIDREATAVFRRSIKQGAERFQWSCRMQQPGPCF